MNNLFLNTTYLDFFSTRFNWITCRYLSLSNIVANFIHPLIVNSDFGYCSSWSLLSLNTRFNAYRKLVLLSASSLLKKLSGFKFTISDEVKIHSSFCFFTMGEESSWNKVKLILCPSMLVSPLCKIEQSVGNIDPSSEMGTWQVQRSCPCSLTTSS